jgi:MarR family 2-MHQ and catechol resistance regulon transcriptional repressor
MPTHFQGSPAEVRALNAFIKLMRASDSVTADLGRHLGALGMTAGQLSVLEALLHLGPLCQHELAGKVMRSTSNVTTVIDNLERDGLVKRTRRVDDRRVVDVSLTPAGRRQIERIFPAHVGRIAERFGRLTADEQAELGRLCRKLGLGRT